jgi:putative glycosyltransferase
VTAAAVDLTVVSTLYRSAGHLEEFYARVVAAAESVTPRFEVVLVNDGSPDDSQDIALALCRRDPRLTLVELSRNFGHHKALMTGLMEARGDRVLLIDSDLEEDPEILGRLWRTLDESGADVVYGVQSSRKGSRWEQMSGGLFYRAFNLLSSQPIPRNLLTVRLMKQPYVQALAQHQEQEVFLGGLLAITGFHQVALEVDKENRKASSYTFRRRLALLVTAITSFSSRPLVFIFGMGCIILASSTLVGVYLVARQVFFGHVAAGFSSLMISIWFLGGLSIFSLGVIGIYLSRIYTEVKHRPYTLIRSRYRSPDGLAQPAPRQGDGDLASKVQG